MNTQCLQMPGQIATHDDELALGQVLDVHHAPNQRQAVGGKNEYGADKQSVQKQLDVKNWRHLPKKVDVV